MGPVGSAPTITWKTFVASSTVRAMGPAMSASRQAEMRINPTFEVTPFIWFRAEVQICPCQSHWGEMARANGRCLDRRLILRQSKVTSLPFSRSFVTKHHEYWKPCHGSRVPSPQEPGESSFCDTGLWRSSRLLPIGDRKHLHGMLAFGHRSSGACPGRTTTR